MKFRYQPVDRYLKSKFGPAFETRREASQWISNKVSQSKYLHRSDFAIADLKNYTDSSMTKLKT